MCLSCLHLTFSKVNHGAEKLPYYPVDFHMEYAMACRKRSRTQRDEEAHANWWVGYIIDPPPLPPVPPVATSATLATPYRGDAGSQDDR